MFRDPAGHMGHTYEPAKDHQPSAKGELQSPPAVRSSTHLDLNCIGARRGAVFRGIVTVQPRETADLGTNNGAHAALRFSARNPGRVGAFSYSRS